MILIKDILTALFKQKIYNNIDWCMYLIWSSAGINLLRPLISSTYIIDQVQLYRNFLCMGVVSINFDVRHFCKRRKQVCSLSHLHIIINTHLRICTITNAIPTYIEFTCTSFSLVLQISSIFLQTNYKLQYIMIFLWI
jgi:hypothetical protein